ncbi:MAG: hypothetical protein ACYC4L_10595 [Chloroflexota bacterium]
MLDASQSELLRRELRGDGTPLADYLLANSRLPGPAGNLTLARATAAALAQAAQGEGAAVWSLLTRWAALPLSVAPVNDPREMLPLVAALGRGCVGAALPEYRATAWVALRLQARDPRWRTRELVTAGLSELLRADFAATLAELSRWLGNGDPLELRAVAAALAEPDLMVVPRQALAALEVHEAIAAAMLRQDSSTRRAESWRTLRQGLGYTASVVVVGAPAPGFALLRAWWESGDGDLRWIVRENLKKARLARADPEAVARLAALPA